MPYVEFVEERSLVEPFQTVRKPAQNRKEKNKTARKKGLSLTKLPLQSTGYLPFRKKLTKEGEGEIKKIQLGTWPPQCLHHLPCHQP